MENIALEVWAQIATAVATSVLVVLPTMEKHYWFFIDSEIWEKADSGTTPLHTALYFEYDHAGKKSGYGMHEIFSVAF